MAKPYFEEGRGWRYNFWFKKVRHTAPRGFATKADCDAAEAALRARLKLEYAGVTVPPTQGGSARIVEWAGVYFEYVQAQAALGLLKRPDAIEVNLSSVLRFWGARPTKEGAYIHPTAPYHDLTLADPIADASWLRRWDEWMTKEHLAGGTRNHYNTTMSRMYWLAMQAEYREASGAPAYNPFRDRPRHKWKRRTATLTEAQIQKWIQCASYHTRLALSIAILNPKFRLDNILQLEWTDIDFARRLVTVWDHKNDKSGEALVATMPVQLQNILQNARLRHPHAAHVILYHGRPVKSIDESVKSAAIAAKLPWGRFTLGGVTFHSLRHSASTLMARAGIPADRRKDVTGHADLAMEQWYTHLLPEDERLDAEALSAAVAIEQDVIAGPRRVTRAKKKTRATVLVARPRRRPDSNVSAVLLPTPVLTPVLLFSATGPKSTPTAALRGLRRGPHPRKAASPK